MTESLLEGATPIGPADPSEQIEVTVLLRPKLDLKAGARLTHEELEAAHGADPQDIARVQAFAQEHNLAVGEIDPGRRTVELSGTVADLSKAFDVQLDRYQHPGGQYRGRTGPVSIPTDLAPIVQGVFGLDDRPQLQPHFRGRAGTTRNAATPSYTPPQVAALYDFPKGLDGSGQQIGILEFGGGFRPRDIKTYFTFLGIRAPKVVAVSIDGARNRPSTPNGADMEVMLDIEVAGAVAPGAGQAVYFAPPARATTLIKEIICPLDRVSKVSPTDPATNLLDQSDTCSEGRTLVVDNGRLVGIVSPSDINRMLQRSIAGRTPAQPSPQPELNRPN